jgi:DNA-binding NtrC family response regulator
VDRTKSLVGKSQTMRSLRERIQAAARHETPVLFTGEPGSGRTLAARFLAGQSLRSAGPFEGIEARELTDRNLDAVLLGSGQDSGALARAAGGILYIAGIDELAHELQPLLLRALGQDAGSAEGMLDECRILTSAAPGYERDSSFLPALQSLIASVVIRVPALRDHAEDVPELLRQFVDSFVETEQLPFRRFSIAAQNRLRNYPWPGNVRELQQLVKQLLVLGGDEDIELSEVEAELASESADSGPLIKQDLLAMPLREAREHFERAYLTQQLQLCGGKVGQLAKRVGMERTHLYRKLRALGVDFRQSNQED